MLAASDRFPRLQRWASVAAVGGLMSACAGSTPATPPPATPAPVAAPPAAAASADPPWPPLPTDFVSGRVATPADVGAGRALFAAQLENAPPAQPSKLLVPQYAYCHDAGRRIRAVVIQAEIAAGMELLGVRIVDTGKGLVTLASSCQLLGQSPP